MLGELSLELLNNVGKWADSLDKQEPARLEKIGDNLWIFRPENPVNLIIHGASAEICDE